MKNKYPLVEKILASKSIVLYHGTLKKDVSQILRQGLDTSVGWGGADTEGVFLSNSVEGALYWAKLRYARENDEKLDAERFDQNHGEKMNDFLAVLEVKIPSSELKNLKADIEQAEDFHFSGGEDDWELSLKEIGDARFIKKIPAGWIKPVSFIKMMWNIYILFSRLDLKALKIILLRN